MLHFGALKEHFFGQRGHTPLAVPAPFDPDPDSGALDCGLVDSAAPDCDDDPSEPEEELPDELRLRV